MKVHQRRDQKAEQRSLSSFTIHTMALGTGGHLTSEYCTSSFHDFSKVTACCTDNVNTPVHISQRGSGCFEDRRPAASSDPYNVMRALVKTSLLETP